MLRILLLLSFLITPVLQAQQLSDIAGSWSGSITVSGQQLGIDFVFNYDDGELDGTIDIPQQNAFHLPVEFLYVEEDSVAFQFQTGTGPAVFMGTLNENNDEISGLFEQLGTRFPFSIQRQQPTVNSASEVTGRNLIIPTEAGQRSGTYIQGDAGKPLVILITGSGSQDRDENVAGFRVFGELADLLQDSSYSSFRYDDIGLGESTGVEDATLQDLADDLEDIIEYYSVNFDDSFDGIVLLGHSQGGAVASIAATGNDRVSGIIFMAAPFQQGDEIINQQIRAISKAQAVSDSIVNRNLEFQSQIYEVVRTGGEWSEIERDLYTRLEDQINTLPVQQRSALGDMESFINSQVSRQLAAAKTDWFKSFIEFNPVATIDSLQVPMLAIFGEKDMQVILEPNLEAADSLAANTQADITTVTVPDANHLFQRANTGMPGEYGMLDKEFADGFIEAIYKWLEEL
ncbi:MAG: alpha/beta hydrolase [Balneolaceae bacterium]|nr:alpha/beta hydrolase [Balneolaceae bacterium]